MKRILYLTPAVVLMLAATAFGGSHCWMNHGVHCICPPEECQDCSCPCEHRIHWCSCWKSEHAHQLICDLSSACCCDRIKAATKLGSRLHADFCCDPEVLAALTHAVLCDTCWEVRRAAAWAIAYQGARTDLGVGALYLASLVDPHYLVRDSAKDALAVLLVCRNTCFKDLFARADAVAKALKGHSKPGAEGCDKLLEVVLFVPAKVAEPIKTMPAPAKSDKSKSVAAPLPTGELTQKGSIELVAPPTAAVPAR